MELLVPAVAMSFDASSGIRVVWVLKDKNVVTGEESSDIMVKTYLYGAEEDGQATDVHYRYTNRQ